MAKQNDEAQPTEVSRWLDSSRGVIVSLDSAGNVTDVAADEAPAD